MIFAVEVTAAVDAAGTEQTFLFSTQGFATRPTDTPANTIAFERLIAPGTLTRQMGDGAWLMGPARSGYGEVRIANHDGEMDAFARHGFGHRRLRLLAAEELPTDYPADWTVLFTGTMAGVDVDGGELRIRIRDRLDELEVPLCRDTFAGTGDEEGDAELAGTPKPIVYGWCFNVPAVLVDVTNSVYLVSCRGGAWARYVRDDGVNIPLSPGNYDDYADWVAMLASAPGAGTAKTLTTSAAFRVSSSIGGTICADVAQMTPPYDINTDATGKPATVIQNIALDAGIASGDISGADVTAVNGATPVRGYGYYARDTSTTALDAVSAVARSAGLWVGFDRIGVLRQAFVAAPSGSPAWTFTRSNSITLRRLPADPPSSAVISRHVRNWYPSSNVDSSIGPVGISRAGSEYLAAERADNAGVTAKHRDAVPLFHEKPATGGYLSVDMDAGSASGITGVSPGAMVALVGVERDRVEVVAPLTLPLASAVDLGAVVNVTWPRHGLDAGKLFLVTGVLLNLSERRVTFTLWG